jgi:anti-sigma regulatory factor (Ser/Thr protein kinase)
MTSLSLEIANDFAALAPASARVREFLDGCAAPGAASFLADLVIEELVTNTIKYGYDDAGAHAIALRVAYDEGRLFIEVRDDGRAFNPLEQAAPDTTLPAEQRDIGGLGIHLVRQMTDSVVYERRGHENVVVATKRFGIGY